MTAGTAARASASPAAPAEEAEVLAAFAAVDAVCFDVDSTVCTDEGIDELAAYLGKGEEVAAWTAKAMGGGIPFEEALAARLGIMEPSFEAVQAYVANNPPKLSPGIAELVTALKASGKEVYLVSGGFRQMIRPVAAALGLPPDVIYANNILFEPVEAAGGREEGPYRGFDAEEFTAAAGGKARAIKFLKREFGHETLAMVGDGATDLEARVPGGADVFIGYGGVAVREKVRDGADLFVTSFEPLIQALQHQ